MRTIEVQSEGLHRGEVLPSRYAHNATRGADLSIPLVIDAVPEGTQSVAFALIDRDANDFVHWLVTDVPVGTQVRLEPGASPGSMPDGARELYNSAQSVGYFGPKPRPSTGNHRYEVVAYALDTPALEVDEHADYDSFTHAAEQHAVGRGENYWLYGRSG